MKKIYILKTAPYSYKIDGLSLYDSFSLVGEKKLDPSIKIEKFEIFKKNISEYIDTSQIIFCSNLKRSIQSAQMFKKKIIILGILREIDFSMIQIMDAHNFKEDPKSIMTARRNFVNGLINNQLTESFIDVIRRIEKLLLYLQTRDEMEIIIFSHGFFMKILEAFLRNKELKNKPKILSKYFDGSRETFNFGEGFLIIEKNKTFSFINYVHNKYEYE